jgi:hypothetical protein
MMLFPYLLRQNVRKAATDHRFLVDAVVGASDGARFSTALRLLASPDAKVGRLVLEQTTALDPADSSSRATCRLDLTPLGQYDVEDLYEIC